MKVRITKKPAEREIDGVNLDRLVPGVIRDVSTTLASWLIAEGYAEPEMRKRERNGGTHRVLGHFLVKSNRKPER